MPILLSIPYFGELFRELFYTTKYFGPKRNPLFYQALLEFFVQKLHFQNLLSTLCRTHIDKTTSTDIDRTGMLRQDQIISCFHPLSQPAIRIH